MIGALTAGASAAPIGAYLGSLWGWRTVFALSAAIGALALLVQMVTLPKLPPQSKPNLRTLFVTSGRAADDSEPNGGALFATEVNVPGLPEPVLRTI